jgi:hypothetical protein
MKLLFFLPLIILCYGCVHTKETPKRFGTSKIHTIPNAFQGNPYLFEMEFFSVDTIFPLRQDTTKKP